MLGKRVLQPGESIRIQSEVFKNLQAGKRLGGAEGMEQKKKGELAEIERRAKLRDGVVIKTNR